MVALATRRGRNGGAGLHIAGGDDFGTRGDFPLNTLPSPHLDGTSPVGWFVRWETQRGCQFACTFCQLRRRGASASVIERNPGEWLRNQLLDRVVLAVLPGTMGTGWLVGAGLVLWTTRGPGQSGPEWVAWSMLLPGAGFVLAALYKAMRGWRLADMRKGASAEERIGQVIEYALTSERCAVAHHVEDIARIGDIDHLVATPRGLWVIEAKYGRVPKRKFPETLRRIALNVAGVRTWAPGMQVTGCLVFAREPEKPPRPTFKHGAETIRVFASPESLMRELRNEARVEGGSPSIAHEVWRLAKVEDSQPTAEQAEGRASAPVS